MDHYSSELTSIEHTTKMNINSLPEVSPKKRIHEGKNLLDTGKIKVILKPEAKHSIAQRMQFLWRNRQDNRNHK